MHGVDLITTLAGSLSAALVCGYVTQRLHLSPIVGYLLAGVLVGPHTPGFVADVGLVVLVLLPAVFAETSATGLFVSLSVVALKVAALLAFVLLVAARVIPWLLDRVADTRSRELFTLTVLAIALGIAVAAAAFFGVSMALGAFLAGLIVGRSEYSLRAASEALPMREAFAVLFFVSIGMLLNPGYLLEAPGLMAATLAVVIVGKPLAALVVVIGLRYPFKSSSTWRRFVT